MLVGHRCHSSTFGQTLFEARDRKANKRYRLIYTLHMAMCHLELTYVRMAQPCTHLVGTVETTLLKKVNVQSVRWLAAFTLYV